MEGVDVDTLTMEQYLALSRENQAPGVVKSKIRGNVNFEIKSQFMRELREDTFSGNKDEDAHDYIDRVLSMVGLFNIPGVSKDTVMLRVFPFTITGSAKRWVDKLAPGTINTWDLLKKAFIQRYYPPSMTVKQLEDIHNFKQEGDKSLYQAWEQYNDLIYKCPTHDINNHQKGPLPGMTPSQALTAIQTMADHSQKWHDGRTSKNIRSSNNKDGLAALVNKLDNLGRDMNKLNESVHAIQVGYQICEGPYLDKDCPLNKEVKQVKEVRYGELGRTMPFNRNNGGGQILAKTIKKYIEEASMRQDLVANKSLTMEDKDVRINRRCSSLLLNQLPPKEKDPVSFILPCLIGRLDVNNALADLGASISIMPFSMYKRLGIGKLEIIKMKIELADNSKCIPKGIVRNLLIKIDKFILPIDFIVLDVLEDFRMPVILGRPLLATAHAKVDVLKNLFL
ncbi:hypothetical protein Tco_0618203 [Tanacetum coccineum]